MQIEFTLKDPLSTSAVATDINRSRINSAESNGEFEDLAEYAVLEKKLRIREEQKQKAELAKKLSEDESVKDDEDGDGVPDFESAGDEDFDDSDFDDD